MGGRGARAGRAGAVPGVDAQLDGLARRRQHPPRDADPQQRRAARDAPAGRGAQGRGRRAAGRSRRRRTAGLMHTPAGASADAGPLRWRPAAAAPAALGDTTHLYWTPVAHDAAPRSRRGRLDALLRAVLAPYLQLAPESLVFGREPRGRPFLRLADAPDFNLSDTVGGTLVAVCGAGRIGVDLERIDRALPAVRIARRWFAPDEAATLATLPELAARAR